MAAWGPYGALLCLGRKLWSHVCEHVCAHVCACAEAVAGRSSKQALRFLRHRGNADFHSQYVGDDADGPAVHSLAVGLLGQYFWSCGGRMTELGLGARGED